MMLVYVTKGKNSHETVVKHKISMLGDQKPPDFNCYRIKLGSCDLWSQRPLPPTCKRNLSGCCGSTSRTTWPWPSWPSLSRHLDRPSRLGRSRWMKVSQKLSASTWLYLHGQVPRTLLRLHMTCSVKGCTIPWVTRVVWMGQDWRHPMRCIREVYHSVSLLPWWGRCSAVVPVPGAPYLCMSLQMNLSFRSSAVGSECWRNLSRTPNRGTLSSKS